MNKKLIFLLISICLLVTGCSNVPNQQSLYEEILTEQTEAVKNLIQAAHNIDSDATINDGEIDNELFDEMTSLAKEQDKILADDIEEVCSLSEVMVLIGIGKYAYRSQDDVYIMHIDCLKPKIS